MTPYYTDDHVTLHHGDACEVLPTLGVTADVAVVDPPYGETNQWWDSWPFGWPKLVAAATSSLWCFGSARMFTTYLHDFTDWHLSQDIVWDKGVSTSSRGDRFARTHEYAWMWYRGRWSDTYHQPQREGQTTGTRNVRRTKSAHFRSQGKAYSTVDDGTRLVQTVFRFPNLRRRGVHPNEKPVGLLDVMIRYACPPGGLVLDPFAGSGSTGEAARLSGRRAILVEADEQWCEKIARRMSQPILGGGQ